MEKPPANILFVGAIGDKLTIMNPKKLAEGLTHDEALNLAAWLVAMAYNATDDFDEVLAAVRSS